MLARLAFSLMLGLLMYVPRPVPRPPINPVPPTPDELPPGDDGQAPPIDIPQIDPPGTPIPMPEIELPDWPSRSSNDLPSVPPTPPPGYEGEWPPATERPDRPGVPPTPPPGHEGSWNPGGGSDPSLRERVRDIIRDLRQLLDQTPRRSGLADAGEGAHKLHAAQPPTGRSAEADALEA